MSRRFFQTVIGFIILALTIALIPLQNSYAVSKLDCSDEAAVKANEKFQGANNILYYEPCAKECSVASVAGSGKDYKGQDVFTAAQIQAINENKSVYEEAAKQTSIPWQMIAVIHLRESGLGKDNPSNGQGIYQDYAKINGPYPTGPVDSAEFLRQTIWAANFLKNKATSPELLATGDAGQVKDAFFGYNGRASAYKTQAESLGFTDAYEGSPYTMNIADSKRDPATNPTGWGQIKSDGGGVEYPANSDHGAFIMYTALGGAGGVSEGCASAITGTSREKIIQIATQELNSWSGDYKKYTEGNATDWCAYFASWVYEQAGAPLISGSRSGVASVSMGLVPAAEAHNAYHPAGSGYTPQAGDLVIYDGHVNILINPDTFETIGGNEGTQNFDSTNIKKTTYWQGKAIGYVSPY